jgi:hypothetical protein
VNPDGSVMVGLPLMSNGKVKTTMAFSLSASSVSVGIRAFVGEAMPCAGTISKSMF